MVLVDTNVILDVITDDPDWADWSQSQLDALALSGDLGINDVVYAELSIALVRIEDLEDPISVAGFKLLDIPREALFLAGKAFRSYRKQGGTRTGVLPDFFIGAQAAVMQLPLLTRDANRYRSYFPSVHVISP